MQMLLVSEKRKFLQFLSIAQYTLDDLDLFFQ